MQSISKLHKEGKSLKTPVNALCKGQLFFLVLEPFFTDTKALTNVLIRLFTPFNLTFV